MVLHLRAPKGKVSVEVMLNRAKYFDRTGKVNDHTIYLSGNLGKNALEFAMCLSAKAKGGRVYTMGHTLVVKGADEAVLYFGADSTFRSASADVASWEPRVQDVLAEKITEKLERAMAREYGELLAEHEKDYREFYDRVALSLPEKEENALEEIREQASNLDATQMKNEMLFASDHTTGKDAKTMEEDGFSLTDTEIPTVVTETDKMKMRLAKSGEDISYFGDGLSDAQIEAMAGSTAMAKHIESALNTVNIPVTENNVKDITETANMMEELHTPDEGSMKYMLDNELPVTTANLYKAEFSGSATYVGMQQMTDLDYDALKQQIEAVISESGMDVNEQNMADGRWLIENGIPLTAESLEKLSTLQQLQLPLGEEEIVAVSAEAISDGIRPQDVVLSGNNFKNQAQDALDVITNVTDEELAYVVTAKIFALSAYRLLRDGAVKAKEIVANYQPIFTKEEYIKYMDSFIRTETYS